MLRLPLLLLPLLLLLSLLVDLLLLLPLLLVLLQVCLQLRQHEPELRAVCRSLGRLAVQCIGSLLRMHVRSVSLLLPLCTSWGFAAPLARARLDDPFLLQ